MAMHPGNEMLGSEVRSQHVQRERCGVESRDNFAKHSREGRGLIEEG